MYLHVCVMASGSSRKLACTESSGLTHCSVRKLKKEWIVDRHRLRDLESKLTENGANSRSKLPSII